MDKNIAYSSASDLANQLSKGEISTTDLVRNHYERIKKYNNTLNAIVINNEKEAIETARKLDEEIKDGLKRGPLHGVPVTLKESFNLKGHKTTVNFKSLKDNIADKDSVIAGRLKASGAIILGKTNVPTLLADNQTFGPLYPTANNPFDLTRTPGGSTGGGAAAVASGLTTIEIGTDIGGSIRNPANFCGIFGLKPTENQYPQSGHVPPMPKSKSGYISMTSIGPLARTMEDIELAWDVINQPEWKYLNSLPVKSIAPKYDSLGDYKIAWFDDSELVECSKSTKKVLNHFIEKLSLKDVKIHKFNIDEHWLNQAFEVWATLFGFISGQGAPWIFRQIMKMKFRQQTKGSPFNASKALSDGLNLNFKTFSKTLRKRQEIIADFISWFDRYDFIISPTSIGPAFKHNHKHIPIEYEGRKIPYPDYNFPFTIPYNACGNPSLIVPGGFSAESLPIGIQIAGPHYSENELIHFGKLVEEIGFKFQAPSNFV